MQKMPLSAQTRDGRVLHSHGHGRKRKEQNLKDRDPFEEERNDLNRPSVISRPAL